MSCEVVGMKTYVSKQGNKATILSCITDYQDYEKGTGKKAFEQYVKGEMSNDIVGKQVKFVYDVGFGGKAVVSGIEVME